jgi:HEAT repeat protein
VRAYGALGEGGSSRFLDEFLQSDDPLLRDAALAGLVEMAEDAELPAVQRRLAAMLGGSPEDSVRVAAALGARPDPSPLHTLLPPLLESAHTSVRCAALRAVGTAGLRDRVPDLIHALGLRDTEAAARDGLLAFGRYVVGTLGDWLADGRVAIEVRRVIPRVLGDVPSREAIGALMRARDREDVILRYRILKASNKIRSADACLPFPAEEVTDDIDYDLRSLLQVELHQRSLRAARDASQGFLLLVLRERRTQSFERVFRRLALLYPAEPMYAAFQGLRSENPRVRGNAAEYVEIVLLPEHNPRIVPLLTEAPPGARWELARTRYGLTKRSPHASLAALLHDDDPWLRACALYVTGCRREQSLVGEVESNLQSRDARVRETAGWAIQQLVRA